MDRKLVNFRAMTPQCFVRHAAIPILVPLRDITTPKVGFATSDYGLCRCVESPETADLVEKQRVA